MSRLENLLGAHSLAVADRLRTVGAGQDLSASEQGALVTVLAHPGQPVSWLGEVLGLTSSGVTRLVDRLEARGWVTRTAASDARQRRLRLTAAGSRRAGSLNVARQHVLEAALEPLSRAERAELERLLDRLVASLHEELMPTMHTCRLCDREACRSGGRTCPLDHTARADA